MSRAALLSALLALCACAPRTEAPPRPRLVVLYATCSLNKDFLAPYDGSVAYTPHLAALARESLVFERHMTEAGVSGIAYASLFTGTQAERHGIYHHPSRLGDESLTLFEAFAAAGYETHYWNGHPMAGADLNYAQGVAPEHVYPPSDYKGNDKSFARTLLQADDPWFATLLRRMQAEPELHALVVANFTVTHAPYPRQVKREALARFLAAFPEVGAGSSAEAILATLARLGPLYDEHRLALQWDFPATVARLGLSPTDQAALACLLQANYAACVGLLDQLVGGCLATLERSGLADETLFAFTADHGEYLFEEQRLFQWGHGLQLAPEELSVPWILRPPPGTLTPGRFSGVTRSIDVFPTLAGLCGVPLPPDAPLSGVDLTPALRGLAPPPSLVAPMHTKVLDQRLMDEFADLALVRQHYPGMEPSWMWVALREGERFTRLRHRGDGTFTSEAFELGPDPHALHPLAASPAEEAALLELKRRLVESYREERGVGAEEIDADLRALGYVR